jgi:cytoskeletal protein RodZ
LLTFPEVSSSLFPVSTSTPLPSNTNLPSPKIPLAPKKKKKSKAWIAGAVVGPVVGLAVIYAFIKALFRRKKSDLTPPVYPMSAQEPSQPQHLPSAALAPTGVQQYTEAKPVFSPQATGYNQSVGAFNPHESYNSHTQQPISPITQSTAPFDASRGAPPYGMSTQDARHVYQHPTPDIVQPNAAELGVASGPATSELPGHHPTH